MAGNGNEKSLKNLKKFGTPGGSKPMNGDHGYPYERWSLRGSIRHLAAQEIDPRDKDALAKLMGKRKPTIAEMIAIKKLSKAMAGDYACMESVENSVDGKLAETIFTPDQKSIEKINLVFVDANKRKPPEQT